MVVADPVALTYKIYEVKYSTVQVPEQYRHLINEVKCKMTSHRYAKITNKYVIYIGNSEKINGIEYINTEEYLTKLQ